MGATTGKWKKGRNLHVGVKRGRPERSIAPASPRLAARDDPFLL